MKSNPKPDEDEMPSPWRISEQNITVLDPKSLEPAFTLMFIHWPERADVQTMRFVPADIKAPAMELDFATGGFVVSSTPRVVERWLRPGETIDPNYHLDDDEAARAQFLALGGNEEDGGVPTEAAARYSRERNALLARRASYYDVDVAATEQVDPEPTPPVGDVEPVDAKPKKSKAA